MRAVLFILILAVVALILAIATGFLRIDQTQPAKVPRIETGSGGVSASGGQVPTFDVETGSVSVEASQRTVPVPRVTVSPPDGEQSGNESANQVAAPAAE